MVHLVVNIKNAVIKMFCFNDYFKNLESLN